MPLSKPGLAAARRARGPLPASVQRDAPSLEAIIEAYVDGAGEELLAELLERTGRSWPLPPESPQAPSADPESPQAPQEEPPESPQAPEEPPEPPGGPGADVTTVVRATSESETAYCAPDDYVVVTGLDLYVDGVRLFANGTKIITIKRVPAE